MATFNTVWSLDLGSSCLKAVRLRREKNSVEILAVDKVDYPMGSNGINFSEQSKEALRAFKVRNEIRDPIIVAHSGRGTLSRFLKIPAFDPKKVKEMVKYEASQQIPFPLEEVIWDYHVIDRDYASGEEREVGIFAARREAIDDYLLDFTSEGLTVEALPLGYLGLLNYFFYDIAPEEPSIVLDLGAGHTDLMLIDGRKFWTRTLQHSGNEINKAIMDHYKVTFPEAEKLKLDCAKNQKDAAKLFAGVIQGKLRDLVNEIHRSIGFYRSQAGEVQFKQIYLMGGGSKIIGIKKFFEEHLGMPVFKFQSINKVRINPDVNLQTLQDSLPAFGTAMGCGIQGTGLGSSQVDLVPQEEKNLKAFTRKKKHVFIAMAILYAALGLAYFHIQGKIKEADEVNLEAQNKLRPIKDAQAQIGRIMLPNIAKNAELLRTVAENRSQPLDGLRILGEVLSRLPLSQNVQSVEPIDVKGSKTPELIQKADELLQQKLWVPWFEVKRMDWPEEAAAAGQVPGARKDAKRETVPAYKFTLLAVVPQQKDDTESLELLTRMFKKPLSEKLLASGDKFTIDKKVEVSPEFMNRMPNLFFEPGAEGRRKKDVAQETFEDGPFFGTLVTFTARLREPKAPEAVVETTEKKPVRKK